MISPLGDVVKGFLVMLRSIFKSQDEGDYHWNPDPSLTEVIITDQNKTDAQTLGQRPLIVTQRVGTGVVPLGMDPRTHRNSDRSWNTTRMYAGNILIHCISKTGTEAEMLATFISDSIPHFYRDIVSRTCLHSIEDQITLSAETPVSPYVLQGGSNEWTSVVLQIPFKAQTTSQLLYDDDNRTRLREIRATITLTMPNSDTVATQADVIRLPFTQGSAALDTTGASPLPPVCRTGSLWFHCTANSGHIATLGL